MRIICFAGPKTCGKDTAANYILARNTVAGRPDTYLACRRNIVDRMKEIAMYTFSLTGEEVYGKLKDEPLTRWPYGTPRLHLQNMNMFKKKYGDDIWLDMWQASIDNLETATYDYCLVTDLRHPNELVRMKQLGALIFYVHREEVEQERLAGIAAEDPIWCDASESHCELLRLKADEVLDNNQGIPELQLEVARAMKEHFGPQWNRYV